MAPSVLPPMSQCTIYIMLKSLNKYDDIYDSNNNVTTHNDNNIGTTNINDNNDNMKFSV